MDEPAAVRDTRSKADGSSADESTVFGSRLSRRKRSSFARLLGGFLSLTPSSFSGAGALVVIGFAAAWILPGLIDSARQRALHRAPVHADHTVLNTHVVRAFPTPRTLVYRDRDGSLYRALVDETDLDHFIDSTIDYLEAERRKIKAQTKIKIDTLLANAFFDSRDKIAQYADWYFGWGRSYFLLKEGAVGGLKGFGANNVQGFAEGAHNEVEAYLIRNYQRIVLRPELRNPNIEAGVAQIFAEAHERYVERLTSFDDRAQLFLSQYTRHLEVIDPLQAPDLAIDWDAQKWKAPRYSTDDEAFRAVFQGAGDVTIAVVIARAAGPAIDRALTQSFMAMTSRVVVGLQPELYGAAAGSFAEPGFGTLAGWVLGAGGAILFDYISNRQREHLDRAEFERASTEALKVTIGELSRSLERDLSQAIDVWFDDTRTIVVEQKLGKKMMHRDMAKRVR